MINLKHKGDLEIDGNIQITGGTISINGNPIGGGDEWTGGTQYILVRAEGADIENAAELQAAYDLAVSLSASSTNRITIIASPGNYNFSASTFTMDTEYIDLVSLDGGRSIIFNSIEIGPFGPAGTISVLANNILVKGVDVLAKPFVIGENTPNQVIQNCKGGVNSFNAGIISGTFIDCEAGDNSFGYGAFSITLSGNFINCKAGFNSFGSLTIGATLLTLTLSGKFTNCEANPFSFGYVQRTGQTNITISSTAQFSNCKGGDYSFGSIFNAGANSSITISGAKFINCESARFSFGFSRVNNVNSITINNSVTFENCKSYNNSFGSKLNNTITTNITLNQVNFKNCEVYQFGAFPLGPGDDSFGYFGIISNSNIINCTARDNSFGVLISSSNFENCTARNNSFGTNTNGVFRNCKAGTNSFGYGEENVTDGVFTDCIAGDNSFGNGTDSLTLGTFTNCVGGLNSFGGDGGSLEAKLYRCQLTNGTFETPTGSGKIVLGIDGNDDVINLPV